MASPSVSVNPEGWGCGTQHWSRFKDRTRAKVNTPPAWQGGLGLPNAGGMRVGGGSQEGPCVGLPGLGGSYSVAVPPPVAPKDI